jgi:hypothetical protein
MEESLLSREPTDGQTPEEKKIGVRKGFYPNAVSGLVQDTLWERLKKVHPLKYLTMSSETILIC